MIQLRITLITFCALLQATVHAEVAYDSYDWGTEMQACGRMKPSTYNMMMELEDKQYYRLGINKDEFEPCEKVLVHIMGNSTNSMSMYKGLFLTVVKASTQEPTGHWDMMHSSKYRALNCSGKMNTAVVNSMDAMMPYVVEEDVFVWNTPDNCTPGDIYTLKGTVVKNDKEILTGLSVTLKCGPKSDKPKLADSCQADYFHGTFRETSFENGYGGWWNDPMSEIRWKRHKGETKSPKTGPSSAYDGDFYVYSEASYPAKPGDRAILNSPPGLNGCFCLRLRCHMYTGPGTIFRFRVNGKEVWNHTKPADKWISGYQSVNDDDFPKIQLELIRGMDFRGDLAMDSITVEKGLCEEDIEGGNIWQP